MKTRNATPAPSYFSQLSDAIKNIDVILPVHYAFYGLVGVFNFVRDNVVQKAEDKLIAPSTQAERGVVARALSTGLRYGATLGIVVLLLSNPIGWAATALAAVGEYTRELRQEWNAGPMEKLRQVWARTGQTGNKTAAYLAVLSALWNLAKESAKFVGELFKVAPIVLIACAPIPLVGPAIALTGCALIGLRVLIIGVPYLKKTVSGKNDGPEIQPSDKRHAGDYEQTMSAELRSGHTLTTTAKMLVTELGLKPEEVLTVGLALASQVADPKKSDPRTPEQAVISTLFRALEKDTQPETDHSHTQRAEFKKRYNHEG